MRIYRFLTALLAPLVLVSMLSGCATRADQSPVTAAVRTPAKSRADDAVANSEVFVAPPSAFSDEWVEAASLSAAMTRADAPSSSAQSANMPTQPPLRAFVQRDSSPSPEPGVLLEYRDATLTIRPVKDSSRKSLYDSLAPTIPDDRFVRTFAGLPAFGVEKGTSTGDPNGDGPFSYARDTTLIWSEKGHEYVMKSRTMTLPQVESLARTLFPTAGK